MKQTRLWLTTIAVLLCSLTASAHDFEVDGIYYDITSDTDLTAAVTYRRPSAYDETKYRVDIPSTVTFEDVEYSVTSIGDSAFFYSNGLTSVTIPESVTSIGKRAFGRCWYLTSITLPEGVTSIGSSAFSNCYGLTSVTIPEGVTSIGSGAFCECSGLTSVTLLEGVTSIGSSAFSYCYGLTSVTIPEGVTSIGSGAFCGCSGLTSVTIPEGVTSIDDHAFYGCSSLTAITIPSSVTSIGREAFEGCTRLTSITVAEDNAMYDSRETCNAIIETSSNTLINGCSTTVIPESVTSIGDYAFSQCTQLASITIPEGVTSIGDYAFSLCTQLASITIPEGVTSIGDYAFYFYTSNSLTSITFPENSQLENIGNHAFSSCSFTSITIPASVTSIGSSAFSHCSSLTSITFPENSQLENIGNHAFSSCSFTSITIPASVTSIGSSAFSNCSSLTSITFPASVTSIGDFVLNESRRLTSITCRSITPPVCSGCTFLNIDKSIPVYVPASSVAAYQSTDRWKEFTNIRPYYDNTLSIEDMEARSGEQAVLSVNLENVVDITNLQLDLVLPEGITIAQDEDGYELIDLSTERTSARKHTIGNEAQADGSMRILCYSGSNAVFSGTEGEVLTVTLDIDGTVQEGDYTIRMKNLVLTEYTDGNPIKHTVPSVEATISVYAYTPGDVNDDGAIDVTDISGVVNFILNTASDGLLAKAADVNDDGAVDVTDISGVVNLILNASATAATSSARDMLRSATTANGSDIRVTVLPFTLEAGEEKEIYVLLDNPGDAFTGIQLDLHMPEGISVLPDGDYYYVDLGSRTTSRKHVLPECSLQEDGSLRVLCYSNSNALFSGEEGDVLAITVAGDEDLAGGVYEMALKNIVLSRPDVTNYKPADYALSILSGDAGEETALTLKGIYTKEVLGQFSAALANNSGITSVDLTAGIEVDNTATLTTGNPNTIVYLAEGDALSNAYNVVIGDECAGLVLTDGYAFAAPVAFSASQASYGRELAEGKYGTIVLPFAPETDDYVFYALTSAGDGVLIFDEVETPMANTPYLYKLRDGKSATRITGNEVAVSSELTPAEAAAWQMVGSYANRTIAAGEDGDRYYYAYTSSDNQIHQVTNTLTVKPYRAYFTTASTGGTQLAVRTRGGEETLIDLTEVDGLCPEVYYDLSGRRVDNPVEGVYIVNGKKVVF